jgi:hypothetical protein
MSYVKLVFYNRDGSVVKSFSYDDELASRNAELVVPDSIGELQLRYVCARRTPNSGYSEGAT